MQLGDPVNAEMNRFYTTECYARLSKLLNPGGIFSFAITSSPEMVGPTEAQLLRSVHSTLRSVFPGVLVIPGENARFLASHSLENLTAEPDELIRRLAERRLDLQYVREYYLFDYLNPTRLNYLQAALGQSQPASVNRDLEPTCYFNSLVVATRQIHPLLGEAFLALSRVGRLPFWTLIGILSLGMVLCWWAWLRDGKEGHSVECVDRRRYRDGFGDGPVAWISDSRRVPVPATGFDHRLFHGRDLPGNRTSRCALVQNQQPAQRVCPRAIPSGVLPCRHCTRFLVLGTPTSPGKPADTLTPEHDLFPAGSHRRVPGRVSFYAWRASFR